MRRRDPVRVGALIGDLFASTPTIARKIAEAKIPDVWPGLVGNVMAAYTISVAVKDGRLMVKMSSSVARHEIYMQRAALTVALNEAVGVAVIRTIIVQ